MANAHVCEVAAVKDYRRDLTEQVEEGTLHPEIRNRRCQHVCRLYHAVFGKFDIHEQKKGGANTLQFSGIPSRNSRESPAQIVEDYLWKLDHESFQKLYLRAANGLPVRQRDQFQSSMRTFLDWAKAHRVTRIGSEALPSRLPAKIAFTDLPVDVVDGVPPLRDYINHLRREQDRGQLDVNLQRTSRQAARNFVIEILKSMKAVATANGYTVEGRSVDCKALYLAVSSRFSHLTPNRALTLISTMQEGKAQSLKHTASYLVRQFLNWLYSRRIISFSGDSIRQTGGSVTHANRSRKSVTESEPKPSSKKKLLAVTKEAPKPSPGNAPKTIKAEATVQKLQTVPLPPICQDWRKERYNPNSVEWQTVATVLGHVFYLWLKKKGFTYAGGREEEADGIVRRTKIVRSTDLKPKDFRLIARALEIRTRGLHNNTITYQLCFNRVAFSGECAELGKQSGLTAQKVGLLIADIGRWLATQKFYK